MWKRILIFILTAILFITTGCQVREMRKEKTKQILDNPISKGEKKVYDYQAMETDLKNLEKKYTNSLELLTIGQSVEGRNIYGIKLGQGQKSLLVSGGYHAREWMTSYLLVNLVELYLRYDNEGKKLDGYDMQKVLNNDISIYFVPMINPDGIDLVLNGVKNRDKKKLISMNEDSEDFSRWKANIVGVDLNRQFNANWEDTPSKDGPSFENYKGIAPLDQPESKAIEKFTRKVDPEMVLAYHLSGSVIFWYYNQEEEEYKRDRRIGKKIGKLTGYELVDEDNSDVIAAGYKDWFVKEFKKPGYTIEIADKKYDDITMEDVDKYILENREVIPYLSHYLDKQK